NGTHAHPLWTGVLLSESGTPIDAGLNQRLELVSLGVSANPIQHLIRSSVRPSRRELRGLDGLTCKQQAATPLPR
ncbi:MAG: hypothetical protein ACK40D_12010, partial [Cyanobacteriota bacterium]